MIEYTTKRFTQYVSEKKVKELILDNYPVPQDVPGLEIPTVDDYIPELFLARKADYGKHVDDTWQRVQGRVVDVMGPLSKLWSILDSVRADEGAAGEIDLFECLDLVEKAITILGQAKIKINYQRQENILYRFTKDQKKAKQLHKQWDVADMKSHGKLFGKQFYKKLKKSANVRKSSKEISSQFGEGKKQKQYKNNYQNNKFGGSKPQGANQPFQTGPPSNSGGGGGRKVQVFKRGKGSGNRGKFLFKFSVFGKSVKCESFDRQTNVKRHCSWPIRFTHKTSTTGCDGGKFDGPTDRGKPTPRGDSPVFKADSSAKQSGGGGYGYAWRTGSC